MLASETIFYWYRNREQDIIPFFSDDNDMVYCKNVPGLMGYLNIEYKEDEWGFFIDSSKRSFEAVLLNNGNKYAITASCSFRTFEKKLRKSS